MLGVSGTSHYVLTSIEMILRVFGLVNRIGISIWKMRGTRSGRTQASKYLFKYAVRSTKYVVDEQKPT